MESVLELVGLVSVDFGRVEQLRLILNFQCANIPNCAYVPETYCTCEEAAKKHDKEKNP